MEEGGKKKEMNGTTTTTANDGAGSSLDALISSFNARVSDLQELAVARNMYPGGSVTRELSALDATVRTMESQIKAIRERLHEEKNAIPKAKKLVEQAQRQQRKLQHMVSHVPSRMYESVTLADSTQRVAHESSEYVHRGGNAKPSEEVAVSVKERKGGSAPRWYVSYEELDSLSSYMRGRLTLEKVNIAVNDIAGYADANSQLIACPKKKLSEETWERALQVRDIAMSELVKGKHFFLESDIKGPGLKLDNTGKAILTVLRHLGRINECRIGQNRVFTLLKQC